MLNDTLSVQNGTYLKFIASLDQLGKTLYLIVVQLIAKTQFDKALCHANHLLKFIQLLKSWKNYDSNKMDKELSSLAKRVSDALLQGAGKLEEVKVTPVQRAAHLCVILDWRKLSLLFQAEAITNSVPVRIKFSRVLTLSKTSPSSDQMYEIFENVKT